MFECNYKNFEKIKNRFYGGKKLIKYFQYVLKASANLSLFFYCTLKNYQVKIVYFVS